MVIGGRSHPLRVITDGVVGSEGGAAGMTRGWKSRRP